MVNKSIDGILAMFQKGGQMWQKLHYSTLQYFDVDLNINFLDPLKICIKAQTEIGDSRTWTVFGGTNLYDILLVTSTKGYQALF